jgi:DnaJ like chaperone protein
MNWGGKVVGGILGLAVAGPFGAALGAALGHFYDAGAAGRADGRDTPGSDAGGADAIAAQFFAATFEVMGHVAKADGRVSAEEIRAARAVMQDFRLDEAQVRAAIAHFTRGKQAAFDPSRSIMALRRACAGRPDLLRVFLEIQMRAALDGTDLQGPSRATLSRVATMLGVGTMELAQLEAVMRFRYGGGSARGDDGGGARGQGGGGARGAVLLRMRLEQAYQILEIEPTAGDEDVVKAYRRQLSRHHPDKLKANGLPESMLEHAKQRTQEIIEAHERIRDARGSG